MEAGILILAPNRQFSNFPDYKSFEIMENMGEIGGTGLDFDVRNEPCLIRSRLGLFDYKSTCVAIRLPGLAPFHPAILFPWG